MSPFCGTKDQCDCLVGRRREDKVGFIRATLRRAPEVIQRHTCSLWTDTEHGTSIDAVEGHHKRGSICGCLFGMFIFGLDAWFECLDIRMHN